VQDLRIENSVTHADLVQGLSFSLRRGQTLGIVGESGSGKTLTGRAVMGLVAESGLQVSGSIRLDGEELVGAAAGELRRLRRDTLAMVFQDPISSLDPVFTIGAQVVEAIRRSGRHRRSADRAAAARLLTDVGITDAAARLDHYPHEFSGGMCQRVVIAMALAGRPRLLVADEPTSALDVTVQAQILALLDAKRRETGMGVLLITHDMGVAAVADRIVVLYAGSVAESAPAVAVLTRPRHPYTAGLLSSVPRLDPGEGPRRRLPAMPGGVPEPGSIPTGCVFAPRCPLAEGRCRESAPPLRPVTNGSDHLVACWRSDELADPATVAALWNAGTRAAPVAHR
jgi:oligopeptide/dipeptide ABC transporter ATP-binding protein